MKLNIAMVAACPFPANHGSPASIREMSEALSSRGHKVHIVTYPMKQDIPVDGPIVHRVSSIVRSGRITVGPTLQKPLLDLLMIFKLCRVIKREEIDIIHAHNYEGALIGAIAKFFTGKPLLYNAVNNMIGELPDYNFIRPKFLASLLARSLDYWTPRPADFITVVSSELFDFFKARGIHPDKMAIVPAGVNASMFETADPEVVRQKYNLGTRPLIAYTGLLDQFQKVEYLIKAMGQVVKEKNDAVAIMVNNIVDGDRINYYKNMAREFGVENNIIFTDAVPLTELPHFLAAADVAVIPRPTCPGFPVKLLNYMAARKAIVSFAGSAKGLSHMYNGIVVENYDVKGLGAGITRLVQDDMLRRVLGENARKSIEGRFDWASIAEKIELIYYKMLNAPALAPGTGQLIKNSYEFIPYDRRTRQTAVKFTDKRIGDRRIRNHNIEFLERRRLQQP